MGKLGWPFASSTDQDETGQVLEMENATEDKLYGSKHVRDLYFKAEKGELERRCVFVQDLQLIEKTYGRLPRSIHW